MIVVVDDRSVKVLAVGEEGLGVGDAENRRPFVVAFDDFAENFQIFSAVRLECLEDDRAGAPFEVDFLEGEEWEVKDDADRELREEWQAFDDEDLWLAVVEEVQQTFRDFFLVSFVRDPSEGFQIDCHLVPGDVDLIFGEFWLGFAKKRPELVEKLHEGDKNELRWDDIVDLPSVDGLDEIWWVEGVAWQMKGCAGGIEIVFEDGVVKDLEAVEENL